MTNQKAIEKIKRVRGLYAYESDYGAFDMAISALQAQEVKQEAKNSNELSETQKELKESFAEDTNVLCKDTISRTALCEYALNQKDKSVTPNDIMRLPSAQPDRCDTCRFVYYPKEASNNDQ